VRFRHAAAWVDERLTAFAELRWIRSTHFDEHGGSSAGAPRSLAGCRSSEPSERRHLDHGVFFRESRSLFHL
jgi:hypothetical protein